MCTFKIKLYQEKKKIYRNFVQSFLNPVWSKLYLKFTDQNRPYVGLMLKKIRLLSPLTEILRSSKGQCLYLIMKILRLFL